MRVSKPLRIFGIAMISAALVAGISALDSVRQNSGQAALSLRWARQIVVQTESLALAADARGERDPVGWAVRLLSQGTDSRIIYASKAQITSPVKQPETYSLDSNTGIFEYSKIFDIEHGLGVKIRLYTTKAGLFGAKTALGQDFTVFSLFMAIYSLLFLVVEQLNPWGILGDDQEQERSSVHDNAYSSEDVSISKSAVIHAWAEEASASLKNLGLNFRELVRGAQKISESYKGSKENIFALRLKIHAELEKLHTSQRTPAHLSGLAKRVERLLAEQNNLAPATQTLIKELLGAALQSADLRVKTERALEPIATDADLAFQHLEVVSESLNDFSSHIKATTSGMIEQARHISTLKNKSA